jgi:TatD DNase family protein
MYIDSHCHLDFPELQPQLPEILENMRSNQVTHALCVSVELGTFPGIRRLAEEYDHLYASVGVHPDHIVAEEPDVATIVALADHPKVVAIGETGLDYYRLSGDLEWQRERFRVHIRAARECGKPLIVHTRSSADDTLRILREERADAVGGVMHCFTETWETAQAAMDLDFYISLSGIVTFKNAQALKEVARRIPGERLLIETDAPYLAPVPFRGRTNQPAYVKQVAEAIAHLRELPAEQVGQMTSANFRQLFRVA